MKLINQGAEAKLFLEKNAVLKERVPKSYRLPILDNKIRTQRTRSEFKILQKAQNLIPVPKSELNEENQNIRLEYIKGKKLAEYLDSFNSKKRNKICRLIGKQIAILHNNHIIHGDLTTSNMILKNNALYFIDFGLSYIDSKIEHKAVDLHLIKQALESKHYKHFESSFKAVIDGYNRNAEDSSKILERFNIVEIRGRYKHK